MMVEHKNIYSALCAAQSEFGAVTKGATNPAFKSKYADLADVAGVVIPTLASHGVAVLHYMVGESLSAMRTEFVHAASETKVSCDVPLIVDKQNMQGMKSATTYAKRIGLESLSGIAPEDDDGNAAASEAPRNDRPRAPNPQIIATVVSAMGNATTGKELLDAVRSAPDAQNVPQVIAARRDAISTLVKGAQNIAALGRFEAAFGPDWEHVKAAAEARKEELAQ